MGSKEFLEKCKQIVMVWTLKKMGEFCGEVMIMWKGIDVSDNQGAINWAQIHKNVDFAILRSVRRSGKADHQFSANLEGCRKRNIPMSVYKYTYAATPEAARQEAQQVVVLLQSYGLTGTMVWWDVEDKDVLRPLGAAKLTECIRAAQEVITAAGYSFDCTLGCTCTMSAGLTLMHFLEHGCGWLDTTKGYRTMLFADEPDQSYKPPVDRWLTVWQYTSCGEIAGIKGDVDLNISYEDPAAWTQHVAESGVIYTVSVADVWTRDQAEAIQQQLAPLGVCGVVHKVQILE